MSKTLVKIVMRRAGIGGELTTTNIRSLVMFLNKNVTNVINKDVFKDVQLAMLDEGIRIYKRYECLQATDGNKEVVLYRTVDGWKATSTNNFTVERFNAQQLKYV
jgi:hypothetical protein